MGYPASVTKCVAMTRVQLAATNISACPSTPRALFIKSDFSHENPVTWTYRRKNETEAETQGEHFTRPVKHYIMFIMHIRGIFGIVKANDRHVRHIWLHHGA